jgi:hypothetical protein
VLVGTWSRVAHDGAAAAVAQGPRASGVYARFAGGGRTLELLGPDGATAGALEGGAGLVAATRQGEDAPSWLVTGTDAAGVDRAAHALGTAALAHRFAVAVGGHGTIPLPVTGTPAAGGAP